MRHQYQCRALRAVEFEHEFDDLRTSGGIKVAGGFIGKEYLGLGDESASKCDALLFAAGEVFGQMMARALRPTCCNESSARWRASLLPASSSGSMTFSSALSAGSNWKDWNTKPASSPRNRALPSSSNLNRSAPFSDTLPLLGTSSPANNPSKVDLPEPDAPTMARLSPASTAKLTSCRMVSGLSPLITCLVSPTACTIAAMNIFHTSVNIGFVIPAKAGIQFNKNAGFRVKPGMTALFILLLAALVFSSSVSAAKNILVFGDSLSAGYGIARDASWVSLLQNELKQTHAQYEVVNASISGETTAGGLRRITKALQEHHPAIVILELGANDGLRGTAITETEKNLKQDH